MNNTPRLLYSLTSPYSRKVMIVADEKGIEFDAVIDVPWNIDTKVPDFNPLGKVPVWIREDGSALFDSRVIVEYLDGIKNAGEFIPLELNARIAVKRWEAVADGIMDAALVIFAERFKRPQELAYADWVERQFGKIHRGLALLNEELGDREYFHGNKLSLADIAVVCALGYVGLRFSEDFNWQKNNPRLAALYERLMELESVNASVPVV